MIDALWLALRETTARLGKLEEQLNTDANNFSKPPSSDSPQKRAERRKQPRSNRPRGAQPGHPKHERVPVSEAEVDEVQRFFPAGCCDGGGTLWMQDEPAFRHQVFELPEVRYQITEYQLYAGDCPHCQQRTTARLPEWVPRGQMGPGLLSWISVLTGQFHLTTRQIQQFLQEQGCLRFSVGAISQAQGKVIAWLAPLYQQIGDHVRQADVAHADETTHYRGAERRWLWCLGTSMAVYFLTHYSRGKAAAMALLGHFSGVLVTDH
jgi:transposase